MVMLIITILTAVIFDLVNGFHDAANSIATIVSTRVLRPKFAVLWASFFNFVAMFIFMPRVADTIANIVKVQPDDQIFIYVIFTGLVGAIAWNLITWWAGLPTSSSHALIGGITGAGIAYAGVEVIRWDLLITTAIFIVFAPILGMFLGFGAMLSCYWIFRRWNPSSVDGIFRKGQFLSAALYSIGHGGNDAQKTMGVIIAVMVSYGALSPSVQLSITNIETLWIILSCQLAMGIGTLFGGWRIVKTMGQKITKLKPIGGFCAETSGALTLFLATNYGIPVSTTHTINGAIMGVGSCTNKFSNVKWGVAAQILWAWILTIPVTGIMSAFIFYTCFAIVTF